MFLDSSAVEHSAVNRRVVGSNPTRGVMKGLSHFGATAPLMNLFSKLIHLNHCFHKIRLVIHSFLISFLNVLQLKFMGYNAFNVDSAACYG